MTDIAHAAYVNSHGQIVNLMTLGAWVPEEGQDPSNSDLTIVHIADRISDIPDFIQSNYYWRKEWTSREKKSGSYWTWENAGWTLDRQLLWEVIREERDNRLQASDWTQIPNNQLSGSKEVEWATYRQALRNIPATDPDVTDPDEVVWPEQPS